MNMNQWAVALVLIAFAMWFVQALSVTGSYEPSMAVWIFGGTGFTLRFIAWFRAL